MQNQLRRRFRIAVFAVFAVLVMLACCGCERPVADRVSDTVAKSSPDTAIKVTDRWDREVRFETIPRRIVSLTPATTELLFAIGAGDQIVGASEYCNYPAEAEKIPRVSAGTIESLNREVLVGMKPDLVLCQWDHHQPLVDMLDQFEIAAMGIGSQNLSELFEEIRLLGKVTGHVAEAELVAAEMKKRQADLESRVRELAPSKGLKVFYEVWDDPLMTAGPNSFIGEMLTMAGLENVFADADRSYPVVSEEIVVARNPDLILAPTSHAIPVNTNRILVRQGWGEVSAIKNNRIHLIDADKVSRCGPRMLDALEEIIQVAYLGQEP
jgi:iron complex transport system substrate-binding protein